MTPNLTNIGTTPAAGIGPPIPTNIGPPVSTNPGSNSAASPSPPLPTNISASLDVGIPAVDVLSPTLEGSGSALTSAVIDVPVPTPPIIPKTPPDTCITEEQATGSIAVNFGTSIGSGPPDDLPDDEQLQRPRPLKKLGNISFNIQGAKTAMAAAQAQVQVEEAVAAARARRLNTRDASTQTVRDPERQGGDIVTIWRLRPRGMESFPHFPRQAKKKVPRGAVSCTAVAEEDEAFASVGVNQGSIQGGGRKRSRHINIERISESVERPDKVIAHEKGEASNPIDTIDIDGCSVPLLQPEIGVDAVVDIGNIANGDESSRHLKSFVSSDTMNCNNFGIDLGVGDPIDGCINNSAKDQAGNGDFANDNYGAHAKLNNTVITDVAVG